MVKTLGKNDCLSSDHFIQLHMYEMKAPLHKSHCKLICFRVKGHTGEQAYTYRSKCA